MAANLLDFYGPGWRIEQRYSPSVLIGNWYEERMRTDKSFSDLNYSPTRVDLIPYRSGSQPDVKIERKTASNTSREHRQNENGLNYNESSKDGHQKLSGNYGLKEQMEKKWRSGATAGNRGGLTTTYTVDYSEWPRKSYLYRRPELTHSTPDLQHHTMGQASHHTMGQASCGKTARCADPTHRHDPAAKDPPLGSRSGTGDGSSARYSRHMLVV